MTQAVKSKFVFSCATESDGFALLRDGAVWQTPAGKPFILPDKKIADIIVVELQAQQQGKPCPATMPFTQLAATALDLVAPALAAAKDAFAQAADNELLCHRADAPPALVERQMQAWQPWLDWAAKRYGVAWRVGAGIMPVRQSPQTIAALRQTSDGFDAFALAGLRHMAGLTGSVVLTLALHEGAASADDVFNAAELETLFQIEQWGEDDEAAARLRHLRRELHDCASWLAMLKKPCLYQSSIEMK